jgi:alkane 1-monooxygenase
VLYNYSFPIAIKIFVEFSGCNIFRRGVTEITRSIVNLIVLRILVGTTSGSSALIVAHELIHRSQRHKQVLGKMLLYTVCYEHFVIAHLQGHHLSVATPEDIATAKLDENFNSYWKRVIVEHARAYKTAS